MKVFNLPDLGEGLPDAEIVEWLVAEGDEVKLDQPMVSMETAKAVVEVPSPFTGKIAKLHGQAGDVIDTGAPLVTFDIEGEGGDAAPAEEAPAEEAPKAEAKAEEPAKEETRADSGTVVGAMESSDRVVTEMSNVGGKKVSPAVRALARKLKVDLGAVNGSGADGVVTAKDVKAAAQSGSAPLGKKPAAPAPAAKAPASKAPASRPAPRTEATGEWEAIRGTRRTMARIMSEAHASIVPTCLMDDADIHAWRPGEDIMARLLRALWAGAQAEPGLNAWYDGEQGMRMVHKGMDAGIAVDTPDGLFVAAVRDVHQKDASEIRGDINRLRENVQNRSIPPEELKDYSIILSNVGVYAGRYATPVITPPCVCIVAVGRLYPQVVPVLGGFEVHRTIPLSVTFDHRACTGGEAARFLRAMMDDLALAT